VSSKQNEEAKAKNTRDVCIQMKKVENQEKSIQSKPAVDNKQISHVPLSVHVSSQFPLTEDLIHNNFDK
jgi:hypothetical protein